MIEMVDILIFFCIVKNKKIVVDSKPLLNDKGVFYTSFFLLINYSTQIKLLFLITDLTEISSVFKAATLNLQYEFKFNCFSCFDYIAFDLVNTQMLSLDSVLTNLSFNFV